MSLVDKIKLIFSARQPATELFNEVKEIKSGWKTLGFWVTVLATLGSLAAAIAGFLPAATALIITTAITVLYNIGRAIQNADSQGVQPVIQSTRFWVGILGIVSTGIVSLQTGGINPQWLVTASAIIAAVMAAAQSVGAQQPAQPATTPPQQ